MNDRNAKNIIKVIAFAAVILPTVLLQAQSSQAIPLDGILDSAGKAFLQNLFGGTPALKPAEPKQTAEAENTSESVSDPNSSESEAISTNQ